MTGASSRETGTRDSLCSPSQLAAVTQHIEVITDHQLQPRTLIFIEKSVDPHPKLKRCLFSNSVSKSKACVAVQRAASISAGVLRAVSAMNKRLAFDDEGRNDGPRGLKVRILCASWNNRVAVAIVQLFKKLGLAVRL